MREAAHLLLILSSDIFPYLAHHGRAQFPVGYVPSLLLRIGYCWFPFLRIFHVSPVRNGIHRAGANFQYDTRSMQDFRS